MKSKEASWQVYILRCNDGTLYTGITTDLSRRIDEHNHPDSRTRYTRSRRPVTLVYQEVAADRSKAGKREIAIKKLTRHQKEILISNGE